MTAWILTTYYDEGGVQKSVKTVYLSVRLAIADIARMKREQNFSDDGFDLERTYLVDFDLQGGKG